MNQTSTQQCLRLYLIRHGEVEGVAPGQLLGQTDKPLSARGMAQAQQLAEQLSPAKLMAVYSSDLQRARLTAEIIAKSVDLKVQESSAWREVDMGDWEEQTVAALHQQTPALVAQIFNDPASFQYPGGESFAEFTARVNAALDELIMTHQNGDVALVAHGGVCRAIIGSALEIPMRNWLRIAQHYGCLNVIEWYSGNPVVSLINRV
jgi:alpha-ribazole phosphatase